MMKKIVLLAFVLVLLSMSMLGTGLVITVSGSTTHHVYPGETIQDAIDSAQPGDTIFVHAGTYYEHVVVGLFNLTLLGEDRSTTIIDGNKTSPWDVVHVVADNVTISGFTIQNSSTYMFSSGIHLDHSFNCSVSGNNINNNWYGIRLSSSSNCSISDNNIYNNINCGLRIDNSSNCFISGNNVYDNDGAGIGLDDSPNCYVSSNSASNNGPSGGVSVYPGISIFDSPNCTVSDNNASNNSGDGISLHYSPNCSVFDNDANNNGILGIGLMNCSKSSVFSNNANNNEWDGIAIDQSHNCSVSGNNASNNGGDGIELGYSSNCSISGNAVTYNEWGIRAWGSGNKIFHNNFIGNTLQAVVDTFVNIWDDDYPSGGNYWSDYQERYPNATEIDGTGIWDTPYVIDENNQDNYPIVPEFPTWTSMLLILIVLTVATIIYKRRLLKTPI